MVGGSINTASPTCTSFDGGVFNVITATGVVDLTLTDCSVSQNSAAIGKGGFIALPDTATDSTFTIAASTPSKTSSFNTNSAKTHGGLFYIGGTGAKVLSLQDTSVVKSTASTGSGGIAYIGGLSSKVTVQYTSLAAAASPNIQTNAAGVNGALFATFLSTTSGTFCDMDIKNAVITGATAAGQGGVMYCSGKGTSTLTLTTSTLSTLTGKQGGGAYYVSTTANIALTVIYTTITTSTATFGPGGVVYFSTAGNTKVNVDIIPITATGSTTAISYSTAQQSGGVFYLGGAAKNELNFGDISVATSVTSQGEGGVAYLGGTDNLFTATAKLVVSSASSAVNAGFIMFAGTATNTASIVGDATHSPSFSSTQAVSTTASIPPNGGLFYFKGITQSLTLTNVSITTAIATGNGGAIYSEVVSVPPSGTTPKITMAISGGSSSSPS